MQCNDITELLLAPEHEPALERHVEACPRCKHMARALGRVNAVLQSTLVCEPPLALQQQLLELVPAQAPRRAPWWSRLFSGEFNLGQLVLQPNVIGVQGLAAIMLALASWQLFGWLNTFQPVVGDVGYAVQLVASSPASVYLGGMQIDVQSLGLWSLVGLGGWLISENGLIGRGWQRLRG